MIHFIPVPYSTDVFDKLCNKALKSGMASDFSDEFYNSLETKFAGVKCGEKIKNENTSGQCYFYSLLLAKSMPDSTLIIGDLNKLNINVRDEYLDVFGHGWVEKEGFVYDTTARRVFNKDWYYKNFIASAKESYSSAALEDPHLFFRLGINAIKDRYNLVKQLYDIVAQNLNQIYGNIENFTKSLKVVTDSFVINELNKYFNLQIKK